MNVPATVERDPTFFEPTSDEPAIRSDRGVEISTESPALVIERDLARRVMAAIVVAVPIGAVVYALLVLLAVRDIGGAILPPIAAGACVGMLAGVFYGMWVGLIVGGSEVEKAERAHDRERSVRLLGEAPPD